MSPFLADVWARLRAQFDPETLGAALAVFIGDVFVATLVFLAFYAGWRLLARGITLALARSEADPTTAQFIRTAAKYAVLGFGAVQALAAAGINTGAVVASLGIAGLTIGFAARDALSNLISGLLIFWDRPFVIGDLVEVEGQYGRVDTITLRSTRVVTVDGRMLAIPNSTVINTTVTSYTNFPHLRLDVPVTVAVTEDLARVRATLLALFPGDPAYMADPPPRVVVGALNDYNVEVIVQAWIHDEREHIAARFALRERIFAALNEAGVEMPFETVQLAPLEGHPLRVELPGAAAAEA